MLTKDSCTKALGEKTAGSALEAISQKNLIQFSKLKSFKVITDANTVVTRVKAGDIAQWNPIKKKIQLNSKVDWNNPDGTLATDQNGSGVSIRLASNDAYAINAGSISATQFMDLTILHELGHKLGADHPKGNHTDYEKAIWEGCFK
jgi:hypothetical protein